jgi:hypothetical protein
MWIFVYVFEPDQDSTHPLSDQEMRLLGLTGSSQSIRSIPDPGVQTRSLDALTSTLK